MTFDFSNPTFWLGLINTVAVLFLWLRRPGEDASKAVEAFRQAHTEAMGVIKGRVDVLEERVRHVPTSEELAQLEGEVRSLSSSIAGVMQQVAEVRSSTRRIEDFLLRNAKS